MKKHLPKFLILLAITGVLFAFFHFNLGSYLNFETLKSKQADLQEFYSNNRWTTILNYFGVYILVTALSLPGAAIMTLAGGAIFGVVTGTLIVSFASTIGATLAFLASRFLIGDWVQKKFGKDLEKFNKGIEKEGGFYLFTLRLIPAFPFFAINLLMGLTKIKTITFFWVSQVGMLAGTIVYVNAGTQLSQLESLKGILSVEIILSFVALGLFPIAAKKIIALIKPKTAARVGHE